MKIRIQREALNPLSWLAQLKNVFRDTAGTIGYISTFSILLMLYMTHKFFALCDRIPFIPRFLKSPFSRLFTPLYKRLISLFQGSDETVNRLNLIDLAIRNMGYKRSRTLITVGGMSVGIAAIVFLVSIGFGLQDLVVGRIARLDELRQADVAVQTGSKLTLDDGTINKIKNISGVDDVQPVIAVVGRVSLNESIFDVAVFGVTSSYLKSSAIKPVKGRIFDSNDLTTQVSALPDANEGIVGLVAGEFDERRYAVAGAKIQDVDFVIHQDAWVPVYESHTSHSKMLGYARRAVGIQLGEEYWGDSYTADDGAGEAAYTLDQEPLGRWIMSTFKLWSKEICLLSEDPDCVDNNYVVMRENEEDRESAHVEVIGYIRERDISVRDTYDLDNVEAQSNVTNDDDMINVEDLSNKEVEDDGEKVDVEEGVQLGEERVLGEATDSAGLLAEKTSDSDGSSSSGADSFTDDTEATPSSSVSNDLVAELDLDASSAALLETEGLLATGSARTEKVKQVPLDDKAVKEAIVNRAMLALLGLSEDDAIGKKFNTSFVVVGALSESNEKIQSEPVEYEIVGIDPENETPFFYVPFIDVRTLGVSNYSQLKVVSKNDDELSDIRNKISVLGYTTTSVVDTVERITSFFGTLRVVLALVGGVALAVASLGMFNTLTVSLLERTREVGLMKAMGMKSMEVRELFLTESMIMGFFGGFFGISIGIGAGKLLSVALSVFALSQGEGTLNISSTPVLFIVLTMAFAMFVGLVTGIFPARRATKISALDALRYE